MIPIAPPERCEYRTQAAFAEASAEGSRRTERVSRNRRDERLARLFQKREGLLAADTRVVFEEVLDRVAAFQEIDQSVNGNAGSDKDGSATEDLGIGVDDLFRVHRANRITLPRPDPVPNGRHVVAEFADVLAVLDEFVAHVLLYVRVARGEAGDAFDHVDDQVEAIEIVEHGHVEWRRGRPLLL